MSELSLELIEEAREYLRGRVRRTPVEFSPELSERLGAPVWLKLEAIQLTGSFKVRGSLFRLSRLTADERARGVATCSAGNHGKGVAYAARELGVKATVYVPSSIDAAKLHGIVILGAEAVKSRFAGYDDTEEWARAEAAKAGKPFLSAFDDECVMAGNGGTLAAEVLEDVSAARTFLLPVGGGGLAAGFSFLASELLPDALFVGCQHERSPALALSLERGEAVTRLPAVQTLAGGIEGGLGRKTFEVLRSRISSVVLSSEDEILEGVRWMLAHHNVLIEPTAAVTVAAALSGRLGGIRGAAVLVLGGRNVDYSTLRRILA